MRRLSRRLSPEIRSWTRFYRSENVQIQPTETGLRLQCPFDPKKPFALAPAFVLCRTEGNTAVLEWKKDAADAAASSEKA